MLVQNVGAYKVLRKLEESRWGTVFLGSNTDTGEKVVIKVFDKPFVLSGDEEIWVTKQVEHANLAKYIDDGKVHIKDKYGNQEEVNYLIVKYYPKLDLFDYVSQSGKFSEDLARYYMRQLTSGLTHFYEKGFAHRDIKLENILLDDEFNLILIDFGFSTSKDHGPLELNCGTLKYMAPELILNE